MYTQLVINYYLILLWMCVAIDLVWQIHINFQTVSESHFREVVGLFVSFSQFHYLSPNWVMRQWLLSLSFWCLSMLNDTKSSLNVCNPLQQEVFWGDFIFLDCKLALPLSSALWNFPACAVWRNVFHNSPCEWVLNLWSCIFWLVSPSVS